MIALDKVSKGYAMTAGRKVVLQDATAVFASGHNYGILGANGVGKSTLVRLLAGSEMPDSGRIDRDARVSFPLGFGGTFHGALSGRENVSFIARVYGASVRHAARYVEEFAELGGYFDMPVNTYSSGMRAARVRRLSRGAIRHLFNRRGNRGRRRPLPAEMRRGVS